MPDSASSTDRSPSYIVIPGAGSSGLVWERALAELTATLLPVPDEPDVPAMAAALIDDVVAMPEPRVVVGASLGAMVALEIARSVSVDALVLIAAGYGIHVSEAVLDWVRADAPDLFAKVARTSLSDRGNGTMVDRVVKDFEVRGQPVLMRHLSALGRYRPQPLPSPPPTLVVWGEDDHSVPLADHAALALHCDGILAPVRAAGHMPFLEQPVQTVRWIRWAAHLAQH
jgi:pimeloyl-ACP methyl ester carboxylesterase